MIVAVGIRGRVPGDGAGDRGPMAPGVKSPWCEGVVVAAVYNLTCEGWV